MDDGRSHAFPILPTFRDWRLREEEVKGGGRRKTDVSHLPPRPRPLFWGGEGGRKPITDSISLTEEEDKEKTLVGCGKERVFFE